MVTKEQQDFLDREIRRGELYGHLTFGQVMDKLDEQAAEIERLRAALRLFVDMPEKCPEADFLDGWARMRAAFANAKAVLRTP